MTFLDRNSEATFFTLGVNVASIYLDRAVKTKIGLAFSVTKHLSLINKQGFGRRMMARPRVI